MSWAIAVVCGIVRVAGALFVKTYFNPDEYWQGPEVAHRVVFGYGYLTWEWQPFARIRGFAHPAIFAIFFKILQLLSLDTPAIIRVTPRLVQAAIATIGDVFLYKLANRWFGSRVATLSLFCQLVNWFYFYCIVRTFSNSVETILTLIALFYWPYLPDDGRGKRATALAYAALSIIMRPTSGPFWALLGLHLLLRSRDRSRLVFMEVVPVGIAALAASFAIDRIFYGSWTFVMANFARFNFGGGACPGAAMYGSHPWHWYVSEGLPAMIGSMIPLVLLGVFMSRRFAPALLFLSIPAIMSVSPHKEFRFVLPGMPIAFIYAGYGLAILQASYMSRKRWGWLYPFSIAVVLVSNAGAVAYFGRWHQRAPVQLMDYLECHATPYYSHLHVPVPMRILECAPEFNGPRCVGDRSKSDSQSFLRDPEAFVLRYYANITDLPSHIVLFDVYRNQLQGFLDTHSYRLEASFFHSHFEQETALLLYRRQP
ncbi:unnamed protein product (mitochondrion) [Plasmodiophora brassicae]|uniref:Mannosyltransferase n=1 Tax=Plasmodiophora brassicae TaxID=37360 RepID=A0A3P3Y0T2_PLABS|nr:unnamed protein product [Plasmodiophora brassicae]